MTLYGANLLDEAIETWRQGRQVDVVMFSKLVQQGYDVPTLEAVYREEPK